MGLISDSKELLSYFERCSWPGRLLILFIGPFFTFNALASISDTVFQWKGFVLDTLIFYRHYFSGPALSLLNYAGLDLPALIIDLLVIQVLTAAGLIRKNLAQGRTEAALRLMMLEAMLAVLIISLASNSKEAIELRMADGSAVMYISFGLILFFVPLLFSKGWTKSGYIAYCLPSIASFLILGIAAAIQNGLTRPI